jgi:hypothetical protein
MWLCMNDSFLSVVADDTDLSRLKVRARRKADLVAVVGPNAQIVKTSERDYPWRTFMRREQFSEILAARIEAIDYENFKNSVRNDDLHDLYSDFWFRHREYGRTDPALQKG